MQLQSSLQKRTDWLTRERCNWLAGIALASIIGYGLGNGHTTENSIASISDRLGQKTAAVNHLERVVVPSLVRAIPAGTSSKHETVGAVLISPELGHPPMETRTPGLGASSGHTAPSNLQKIRPNRIREARYHNIVCVPLRAVNQPGKRPCQD